MFGRLVEASKSLLGIEERRMRTYILRRLLLMVPTIFLAAFILFTIVRLVPGDVLAARMGEVGQLTPETEARMRKELGLDRPFLLQFAYWSLGVMKGDLGRSLYTQEPVLSEILVRLPVSLELGVISILVTVTAATVIGIISAVRQDTLVDYMTRVSAIGFISIPNFWIATIVVLVPAILWEYSPPVRYVSVFSNPWENMLQFAPPGIILGLHSIGGTMRLMRSSLLEVMRQDYIRTARAKGLAERGVIWRHALKNALIPVVTLWGSFFSIIVSGSVIVENIFGLPGMGQLFVQAISFRDYTQIQGLVLMLTVVTVVLNLLVDLTYGLLDPRIKY